MSINILYVNTPIYTGGAEISLLTLVSNLDPQQYRPLLVAQGEGQFTETVRNQNLKVLVQNFPWFRKRYPWRYPISIVRLVYIIMRYQVSLVHANCDHSLGYVMRACKLSKRLYVAHVRDFMRTWFEPHHVYALNKAAAVIANSQAIKAKCLDAGVTPARVKVIYNPIDIALYEQELEVPQQRARNLLGLPSDAFIVGIIGQIQPIKGHAEFIEAAARVVHAVSQVCFIVVGDAFTPQTRAFKGQLIQTIKEKGLLDRFHFLGFRNDIPRILRALNVLVVPSWSEPFGRVVVEAQAAGCPVIGTNIGGIPEIIQDSVNGLLIPPKDPASLAGAIIRLVNCMELREQLSKAGSNSARRFSIQQHVNQIQLLYDTILNA